jgi:formylglycine-generating enzyme required for sulfatase activity
MFCIKCGENLPEDAKFCFKCGDKTIISYETALPEKDIESEVKEEVVEERLITPLKKKPVTTGVSFVGKYRLVLAVVAVVAVAVLAWMVFRGLNSIEPGSIEMVLIPAGTFQMGSTSSEADSDERPVHSVTLSSFQIGKYEVTQGQWKAVMGSNPSYFPKGDNYPVEQVSRGDVQSFITKLNQQTGKRYRLPTEAEWEYAARGGTSGERYGTIDDIAWYSGNSGSSTHPVGQKQPNAYGLYDMLGNVSEWCQDWYSDYTSSAKTNPTGPSLGSFRVLRGGSRGSVARNVRAPNRHFLTPYIRFNILGFRLASTYPIRPPVFTDPSGKGHVPEILRAPGQN